MAAHLTFPILTIDDLISGFRMELGPEFDIRRDDILKPSKDRWLKLYCFLLAHMTDNDVDEMTARLRAVDHSCFDYPELYSESQLLMNLAKFMSMMLGHCRLTDFTLDDIVMPTKLRLHKILSGILNYIRFRSSRKQEFLEIVQKRILQAEKRETLKKENEELMKKVEGLQKQRAEQDEEITNLYSQMETKTLQLEQWTKSAHELDQEVAAVKMELAKKNLESQKRNEKMKRLAVEIAEADEQIVKSPERFQQEIQDMENKLERLDVILREKNEREISLKQLCNPLRKVDFHKTYKEMSAAVESQKKIKQLTLELAETKDATHDLEELASLLAKDVDKLKKLHAIKQEKFDKLSVINHLKEEEAELQLQKLREEEDRQKELGGEYDQIETLRQEIQHEASVIKTEHEEKMACLREDYSSLVTEFENYNMRFLAAMEKIPPEEMKKEIHKL